MADLPPSTTVTSPLLTPPSTTVTSPLFSSFSLFLGHLTRTPAIFRHNFFRLLNWREYYVYSFLIIMLVTTWNLAIVVVTIATLLWTVNEKPSVPLRVWLAGKSFQRAVHALLLLLEYKRRLTVDRESLNSSNSISSGISFLSRLEYHCTDIAKTWWRIGLIWMAYGGETLEHDAPCLYWFTKAVLAPDVVCGFHDLLINYLLFLSSIGFPLFQQRGASLAEIKILPKYGFKVSNDEKQLDGKVCKMVPMRTNGPAFSSVRVLQAEDSGCCICLCKYEDGAKLNSLPCKHHFHAACLFTWLRIKATCPLCKKVIY